MVKILVSVMLWEISYGSQFFKPKKCGSIYLDYMWMLHVYDVIASNECKNVDDVLNCLFF